MSSSRPVVSVLLPFRNAASTLRDALESTLADQRVPLELIAVDDGSTDDGAAVAEALARRDSRLVVLRTPALGIVNALRVAAAHASGPLLARMDADDLSAPTRFADQVAFMDAHPSVSVVATRVEAFPGSAVAGGLRRYVEWQNALLTPEEHARDMFVESPVCHPSVLMRRTAYEAVGGYRDCDWAEDYDLWLRLDAAHHRFAKLPQVLLRWRQSPQRLTFTDARYSIDAFRRARAHYLAARLVSEPRSLVVWGAGPTGKRLARALEAHGIQASAFVDIDPDKIGGLARGAPVWGKDSIDRERNFVVAAVGSPGAREEIRAHLTDRAFIERSDFVTAA